MNNRCQVSNMTLVPTKLMQHQVSAEQALLDFSPHGYNCSSRSLGSPLWQITNFSFNRTWNHNWDRPGFMDEVCPTASRDAHIDLFFGDC